MGCERNYGAIVREGKVILCKWRGAGGRRNCGTPSNPTSIPDPGTCADTYLHIGTQATPDECIGLFSSTLDHT